MAQRIRAIYRNGAFIPQQNIDLPEGVEVEVVVKGAGVLTPAVNDPEERARLKREFIEKIKRNPFPSDAPRFTRDELHERR